LREYERVLVSRAKRYLHSFEQSSFHGAVLLP